MVNVTAAVMLRKSKGYCENQRVTAYFTAAPYFGGLGGLQNSPRIYIKRKSEQLFVAPLCTVVL